MGGQETPSTPSQFGFRIYKLIKDGPLSKGGAKEITDFIIPPIDVLTQKMSFNDWIKSLSEKTVAIKIYSLLYRSYKYIEIKANNSESKEGVLGAAVKYENFERADKNILHITSVKENSFAKNKLNLIPNEDYIIAVKTKNTPIIPLNKEGFNPIEILNIIIKNNIGNDITFFIYNNKNGSRIVETKLEKEKNEDNFTLGCDVAYGALHEFPQIQTEDYSNEFNEEDKINKETINDNIENKNDGSNINVIKPIDILLKENNSEENKEKNFPEEEKNKYIIEEDII